VTETHAQDAPPDRERIALPNEAATVQLGSRIGAELEPGDLVAIRGPIGAGKTALARAILRARLDDPELEAPSPSFTLMQSYEGPRGPVVHADLYRIGGEGELVELGLDEMQQEAAILVEWPERAPILLDRPRLDVSLALDTATGERSASLSGTGALRARLNRARALEALLEGAGWGEARRLPMSGDASTRLYQRLERQDGETAIVMISPPRPDGPPVRRGKTYSAIARLAESVHAFVAIDRGLLAHGFSAPRILAEDIEAGLLLIEDLGPGLVVDADGPIPERYAEATRALAALHALSLPSTLPVAPGCDHAIPPYDLDAMTIEIDLLLDWYLPHHAGREASGSVRAEFGHAWREALAGPLSGPKTWTLRDYHSPNLIWLPEREGIERVGIIDFQDAVLGPPAYDVASLLQDARVTVPPELELRLLGAYAAARRAVDPDFDVAGFAADYAIMAAQRATKILGIFARLDRRDGKPQYLRHIPRIADYLRRNLDHPALSRLRAWYEAAIPDLFPPAQESSSAREPSDPRATP
jgi:tRNA threonylcarbamoyl adenosine modification protein YjeE